MQNNNNLLIKYIELILIKYIYMSLQCILTINLYLTEI